MIGMSMGVGMGMVIELRRMGVGMRPIMRIMVIVTITRMNISTSVNEVVAMVTRVGVRIWVRVGLSRFLGLI